jgi:predicted nucleic acid-binding protein
VGLIEDVGTGPVGLDTAVFIYFLEENPSFLRLVEPIFAAIDGGDLHAFTSAVTLLEVLVVPYRSQNEPLAERYESLLTRSRGLRLVDLDLAQLRAAARLRAVSSLRTPDALQLAAALTSGCTAFVTGDRRLPAHVGGMKVLRLVDYTI